LLFAHRREEQTLSQTPETPVRAALGWGHSESQAALFPGPRIGGSGPSADSGTASFRFACRGSGSRPPGSRLGRAAQHSTVRPSTSRQPTAR
jgi:hypothetical protein